MTHQTNITVFGDIILSLITVIFVLTITAIGDILESVQENSEGRREYRKGKQEDNVTPGNRIREIEMFKRN